MKYVVSTLSLLILVLIFCKTTEASNNRPLFLDNQVQYLWPTNASTYMSSSFGESRAAHFHAAIDIGTWGHEGYQVYAARDGYLHRVAVGPVGYGNVIYLKHDDGSISLYAHLKDFHPKIRALVDSIRFEDYSFVFDRVLDTEQLFFSRGDLIGWTGSTGVGPPHLHFELRTPDGHPFNPFLAGVHIKDTISPLFSSLAVEPLSPHSTINGSPSIHRIHPSNRFNFGTITASGKIGLAVNAFDQANESNNVHAVYELKMFVNDELYFHSKIDSFSYRHTRQMFIDRIYDILKKERRGYQRLYIHNGNTLPFYQDTGFDGTLDLPPGRQHVRIVANDYFGNTSEAVLTIIVESASTDDVTIAKENSKAFFHFNSHDLHHRQSASKQPYKQQTERPDLLWHPEWVRNKRDHESPISLRLLGTYFQEQILRTAGTNGLMLSQAHRKLLTKADRQWLLNRIDPERPSTTIYHDRMRLMIRFPEYVFFEPLSIGISGTADSFTLFPDTEPFDNRADIRILLDDMMEKKGLCLFQQHPRTGKPVFISSDLSDDQTRLTGQIRSGGHYFLKADTTGPVLDRPGIRKWRHNHKPFAYVHAEDSLSGIDYHSAIFFVNGVRGIAEYDPEKNIIRYHHPTPAFTDRNTLEVEVSDRAGNRTRAVFRDVPYN